MDCSMPGFPVLHYFPSLLKLTCIESVMPSNHRILQGQEEEEATEDEMVFALIIPNVS